MMRFSFLFYFIIFFFMNGAAQAAPPYPPSSVIETVTWDFQNLITILEDPGSDIWPMTWGPDDNIYTSFGDGWGFRTEPVLPPNHIGLGFARIEGGPLNIVGTNTYAPEIPQFINGQFNGGGKVGGMLSLNSVLYAWKILQDDPTFPNYKLIWSNDLGFSWNESTWTFNSGIFTPSSFLNFGRDYAGARDGFVYSYGGKWGFVDDEYLVRVPIAHIKDKTRYEYYSGDQAGNPAWTTDINGRKPVFTDVNLSDGKNNGVHITVVYNPIIQRYLLTAPHGTTGKFGLFDAPEPWGPWTTVAYVSDWGGFPNNQVGGEALLYNFVNKWTSADGLTMWMVFSGAPPDSYNQVKATLKLKQPSVDTTPPAAPVGLKVK